MQHTGAVVAREYGLPCIVGAAGATNVFQTGELNLMSTFVLKLNHKKYYFNGRETEKLP